MYLAEGTPYLPADPFERAKVMQWLCFEQERVESQIGALRHWTLTGKLARRPEFLVEMKRSVKENRTEQYLEAHYQFHFRIYDMCRMPIVEEIIENAWLRCAPTLRLGLPKYIPGLKRFEHHVQTLAALSRGDGAASRPRSPSARPAHHTDRAPESA